MRAILALAAVAVGFTITACGGSDDDASTSGRTTATKPTEQSTPAPAELRGSRAQLQRCVDDWNEGARAASDDRAQAILTARAASDPDSLSATVTLYDGEPMAERKNRCVIVVAQGSTRYPLSPVKGTRVWKSACRLVEAKPQDSAQSECPTYTRPLAAKANAEFASDGELRLGGS